MLLDATTLVGWSGTCSCRWSVPRYESSADALTEAATRSGLQRHYRPDLPAHSFPRPDAPRRHSSSRSWAGTRLRCRTTCLAGGRDSTAPHPTRTGWQDVMPDVLARPLSPYAAQRHSAASGPDRRSERPRASPSKGCSPRLVGRTD